jgi:hypothetical protein
MPPPSWKATSHPTCILYQVISDHEYKLFYDPPQEFITEDTVCSKRYGHDDKPRHQKHYAETGFYRNTEKKVDLYNAPKEPEEVKVVTKPHKEEKKEEKKDESKEAKKEEPVKYYDKKAQEEDNKMFDEPRGGKYRSSKRRVYF